MRDVVDEAVGMLQPLAHQRSIEVLVAAMEGEIGVTSTVGEGTPTAS